MRWDVPIFGLRGGSTPYFEKIRRLYPSELILYTMLGDMSGTTALDSSGNNRHGTYASSGVTLGNPGIGDGRSAATFSGADTYVSIGSASFGGAWNGDQGSAICWAKARDASIWSDGLVGWWMHIRASDDVDFNCVMGKSANNTLQWRRRSGAANPITSVSKTVAAPLGWQSIGMTWNLSVPEIRAYHNGQFVGAASNGFTSWTAHVPDSPNITLLGAGSLTLQEWFGQLAHCAIWAGRVLTDAEMFRIGIL